MIIFLRSAACLEFPVIQPRIEWWDYGHDEQEMAWNNDPYSHGVLSVSRRPDPVTGVEPDLVDILESYRASFPDLEFGVDSVPISELPRYAPRMDSAPQQDKSYNYITLLIPGEPSDPDDPEDIAATPDRQIPIAFVWEDRIYFYLTLSATEITEWEDHYDVILHDPKHPPSIGIYQGPTTFRIFYRS